MTIALPRRRVAVPVGRLARQPWPTADVRRRSCATADVGSTDTAAHHALHDEAVRLADLVRGLHHGTATLRRPDLLGARLRQLCDDAAPPTGDDRLVEDLRTAAGLAVHALQSRPLALATPADFDRLERLARLLTELAAACASDPTRRPERGARARSRRARRADRALFG
ncbi:hypothetical protein [Actinomycetospora soli]|uniref:hypothetical protein n=1 Tax=Actinomycetospora soli TaxID=2893887 RepID=UPI001E629553|nr:hypothetical protein [Actinomycetospora soli]MCD2190646.1 hypothetical protein [Actinomycetospora soli]